MHNPHTGHDAKEEEDQDEYKESDGEAEDGRSPVALVASHSCVLLPFFRVRRGFRNPLLEIHVGEKERGEKRREERRRPALKC